MPRKPGLSDQTFPQNVWPARLQPAMGMPQKILKLESSENDFKLFVYKIILSEFNLNISLASNSCAIALKGARN